MRFNKFREEVCSGCGECSCSDCDIKSCDKYIKSIMDVYCGNNVVVAICKYNGRTVRGVAKCNPTDTFDLKYGTELAIARCNNKIAQMRLKKAQNKYADLTKQMICLSHKVKESTQFFMDSEILLEKSEKVLKNLMKH